MKDKPLTIRNDSSLRALLQKVVEKGFPNRSPEFKRIQTDYLYETMQRYVKDGFINAHIEV